MAYNTTELLATFSNLISSLDERNVEFNAIEAPENYSDSGLIFIAEEVNIPEFRDKYPAVIITSEKIASSLGEKSKVLIAQDVRLAQALIKQHYQDYDPSDSEWGRLHPSAVIHPSAKIDESVIVGPNSVIGEHAAIGPNTVIRANVVIEKHAEIGSDCIINNLVNIGQGCRLGKRVIIRPGAIIGNEGFGFAKNKDNQYQRVPHTGIVVIEDDVQIGSNCNIDRATYGITHIMRGVKIDALCHIAHNCIVKEDALFVAQSGIAGSCNIGERVICSGQTGMLDHQTVADDAVLVHRCGVVNNIPHAGMWAGTPAKPFKEYAKNLSAVKKVKALENELKRLKELIDT